MKPYYQDASVKIYHADCRELLSAMKPGSVDLVLTDPPYGLGHWQRRSMIGRNGASRLWGKGETWDDSAPSGTLIRATVAAGRAAILWGGNYFELPPAKCWLIWDKMQRFSGADGEMAWTNLTNTVRFFRMSRIEAYTNNAAGPKQHPTQKPIELMRWCLEFVPDAKTILDPFMGSGTTLRAAKDLGRKAVGIEIEEKYCAAAAKRMEQNTLGLPQ